MSKKKDPTPWREVHGILLLDKPPGLSSNQALQKARRLFLAAKGGHTGSLDPMATGLLPLCFGEATKIAGYLLGAAKAYRATVRLGATTTTADADGEILQRRPVPALDTAAIEAALAPLRGRIVQVPPVYSALKLAGVPLYKRARDGEDVSAAPREVEVFRLDLLRRAGDELELDVECGSGTYVRSLARDLGEALGCGAHLTGLRRTWIDPFREPRMYGLDELERLLLTQGREAIDALLLDTDAGLAALPAVALDAAQALQLVQGQPVAGCGAARALCRVH
uniref:tRNA pseudouridine(55) synthase TruB n=1 Tax=Tahibacter caeni TaxID=1453545 RepID=UPI0021489D28